MSAAAPDLVDESARYRRELVAYCYRMLGSAAEAEDAAQETLVRAWRASESFEGRSALRSWLYRIATNVCIDMQRAPQRRALAVDLSGPSTMGPGTGLHDIGAPLEETVWIQPIHDSRVIPDTADPAETALLRDSVRLALVAALQHLPPKQRAILVLREVLGWSAAEVAELLETSVDSVTSALARARATMAKLDTSARATPLGDADRPLLERYVAAFEAYDVSALVDLLVEDANFSMPPYTFWLHGLPDIERWWDGPGRVCEGSRMLLTRANGGPAVAVYHPVGDGRWEPFALHVLEVRDGLVAGICHFLDTSIFPAFDLPAVLEDSAAIEDSAPLDDETTA